MVEFPCSDYMETKKTTQEMILLLRKLSNKKNVNKKKFVNTDDMIVEFNSEGYI